MKKLAFRVLISLGGMTFILLINSCCPTLEELEEEELKKCIDEAPYIENQYIVYFDDDVGRKIQTDALRKLTNPTAKKNPETTVTWCGCNSKIALVQGPEIKPEESIAQAESQLDPQGEIGKNFILTMGPLNNLGTIPATTKTLSENISLENPMNPVVVGIVDMGFDFSHDLLARYVWKNPNPGSFFCDSSRRRIQDSLSYNFYTNDTYDVWDSLGHGTHIAGIVSLPGGNQTSIYRQNKENLRIMSLKITKGSKTESNLFTAACAIEYAIEHDVDILNLSWGYYSPNPDPGFLSLMKKAKKKGVLVVTSAGNDSLNTDYCKHWPSSFSSMSSLDNVIAVAALNSTETKIAPYSNYGRNSVQFAAPGTKVWSTFPVDTCEIMTGTSMAAPFIGRIAAIIKTENPQYDYNAIIEEMKLNFLEPMPNSTISPNIKTKLSSNLICR